MELPVSIRSVEKGPSEILTMTVDFHNRVLELCSEQLEREKGSTAEANA